MNRYVVYISVNDEEYYTAIVVYGNKITVTGNRNEVLLIDDFKIVFDESICEIQRNDETIFEENAKD